MIGDPFQRRAGSPVLHDEGSRLVPVPPETHGHNIEPAPRSSALSADPYGFGGRQDGLVPVRCWCDSEEVLVPADFPARLLTGACDRRYCSLLGGDRFLEAFEEVI